MDPTIAITGIICGTILTGALIIARHATIEERGNVNKNKPQPNPQNPTETVELARQALDQAINFGDNETKRVALKQYLDLLSPPRRSGWGLVSKVAGFLVAFGLGLGTGWVAPDLLPDTALADAGDHRLVDPGVPADELTYEQFIALMSQD